MNELKMKYEYVEAIYGQAESLEITELYNDLDYAVVTIHTQEDESYQVATLHYEEGIVQIDFDTEGGAVDDLYLCIEFMKAFTELVENYTAHMKGIK